MIDLEDKLDFAGLSFPINEYVWATKAEEPRFVVIGDPSLTGSARVASGIGKIEIVFTCSQENGSYVHRTDHRFNHTCMIE
uniref:Uncharacterized protein n=1 Tax=Tetranychus urticae TaxID=32264 RepID=T1JSD2_TETUR